MNKLKPLAPSLRERKRFVAYEIISEDSLGKGVSQILVDEVKDKLGVFDTAQAGILDIEYHPENQEGILRVSHDMVDKVRTAMALTRGVKGKQVVPRVKGLSGNLKKAREKYIGR